MSYFEKINTAWKAAIDGEIMTVDEGKHPVIANAFREFYARFITEVEISAVPSADDIIDLSASYVAFSAGWNARVERS